MTFSPLPRIELASKIVEACKGLVASTAQAVVNDACQTLPASSSNVRHLMYDQAYYAVRDNMTEDLMKDDTVSDERLQELLTACNHEGGLETTIKALGLKGVAAVHQDAARQRILSQFN
ncbi:MAG: hypothetical protein VX730_06790 [Pseudomonadota bacterium]|nr:hypothetical protein [Pseudomonadota bacterium]